MGRLEKDEAPLGDVVSDLWLEILEGSLVWGEPTEEQKARKKARRGRLLRDSGVPWIVSDIGAVLQFYDDAQDIVSFARWNKRLLTPKGIFRCVKRQSTKGRRGSAALFACLCAARKGPRKRTFQGRKTKRNGRDVAFVGILARFFPGLAPLWYLLLLGQVSATVFGYGISLGPLIGAAMELAFRGLDEVGLPFDPSHNKYHQLKRARLLRRAREGIGATAHLDWDDKLTSLVALRLALEQGDLIPEIVIDPRDYPDLKDLLRDPTDTVKNASRLLGSLAPNAVSYLAEDFMLPIARDIAGLLGGDPSAPFEGVSAHAKEALRLLDKGLCPDPESCTMNVSDVLAVLAWAASASAVEGLREVGDRLVGEWFGGDYLRDVEAEGGFAARGGGGF